MTFRDDFLSPSAVTRAERQLRAIVIAHEMAHMWFGDLVTMRWWNDVWLSESFAEYMGFRVLADATSLHRYLDQLRTGPQDRRLRRGPALVGAPGRA